MRYGGLMIAFMKWNYHSLTNLWMASTSNLISQMKPWSLGDYSFSIEMEQDLL